MDDSLDSLDSLDTPDALKAQRWLRAGVGTLALLAILFSATAVIVKEGEAVLITRFGRPFPACTGSCPGRSTGRCRSTCGGGCMRPGRPRC